MKRAEDIINRFINEENIQYNQERDDWVIEAMEEFLAERDQEIIQMIDDMEMDEMPDIGFTEWELMAKGYDIALKELRSKL